MQDVLKKDFAQAGRTDGLYDDLIVPPPLPGQDLRAGLRTRLQRHGQFGPAQMAGRRFPIACVALEVTQRCNLDCSLCYLSDLAEAVPDPSLEALLAKVDQIHTHYGARTNVQITGGDPTLRKLEDLEVIVSRIREHGMRSALFTNGIRAKCEMLERLATAGLDDVCFHVDITQDRAGFDTEAELNSVRVDYLERARGLGLRVNFNTTVCAENLSMLPDLVCWFTRHAEEINLVSFQMQADTGRGVLGARDADLITQDRLTGLIEMATDGAADFEVFRVGHDQCNRHASILVAGGRTAPAYPDAALAQRLFEATADRVTDWNDDRSVLRTVLGYLLRRPTLALAGARAAWRGWRGLLPSLLRGERPHRLSFFIHNFMSADQIDRARCESCVFTVMTDRGPLSMCAHNADRDRYVMGDLSSTERAQMQTRLAFKHLKGRLRSQADAVRRAS